eukprot:8690751-Pyramimonas_sp.AAC.1
MCIRDSISAVNSDVVVVDFSTSVDAESGTLDAIAPAQAKPPPSSTASTTAHAPLVASVWRAPSV